MYSPRLVIGALAASAVLGACSSSSGPSNAGRQVAFQVATRPGAAAPLRGAALAGQEVIAAGSDTIIVSSVQFVLRKIELERAVASPACDSLVSDDDCEELKAGPVVVDLPLGAGATRAFSVAIDTGSYAKVKLEIHKPSGTEVPGFDGVSIRVVGTYNGNPFTYESNLDAEQEFEFNPPLAVTDSTGAQLTLLVDLTAWFDNGSVGSPGLIDPNTALAGGANEDTVKDAIEASLKAFEDDNRNGQDDHTED